MLSSNALTWIGFAIAFLHFAGQWIDPANTKTPWSWSGPARAIAFAVVSVIVGVLQHVVDAPSTPWLESLVTALLILGPSLFGHFAHSLIPTSGSAEGGGRFPGQVGFVRICALAPLVVVALIPLFVAACNLLGPATGPDLAAEGLCVEEAAHNLPSGLSLIDVVARLAIACRGPEEDILRAIIASKAPQYAPYVALAESTLHDAGKLNALKAGVAVKIGHAR